MELIKNQEFGGERPLFAIEDTRCHLVHQRYGDARLRHRRSEVLP